HRTGRPTGRMQVIEPLSKSDEYTSFGGCAPPLRGARWTCPSEIECRECVMFGRRPAGLTARRTGVGFATAALAGAAAVALPGAAGADTLPENCTAYTPPFASTQVTCEF